MSPPFAALTKLAPGRRYWNVPFLFACAVLLASSGCSGLPLSIPPTPTPDPSEQGSVVLHNHSHGEGGPAGRLVTRYGGPVSVALSTQPAEPTPRSPFTITYTLKDQTGAPLGPDRLSITHEHPMHLILVSQDLRHFSHIHPQYTENGNYAVADTLPAEGRYLLFNEFFTTEGVMQLERHEIATGGTGAPTGADLTPDLGQPLQVGELTTRLTANAQKLRRRAPVTFTLTVTGDGKPVTDLQPYLGAPAHVVIISADTRQFAHTHGDLPPAGAAGRSSRQEQDVLPSAFGPNVTFTHTFMQPGPYRLWVQFGHQGEVLTAAYNVEVSR